MSNIVRAWKDETYRQSLSVEEQAMLPTNPAGEVELTDAELEDVYGACDPHRVQRQNSTNRSSSHSHNTINQDADQTAVATFGDNNIVLNSQVWCRATNDADQDANIRYGS